MQHKVIDVEDVVIRFAGDSGDGMQLTGSLFANMSAIYGNELSTFPDFPAEIRAPHGTVSGVSGFQVHFGSGHVTTPGDFCDMLVAMNPAALKSNAKWLKRTALVLIDEDTFDEEGIRKAGFQTMDPVTELKIEDRTILVCPITTLTAESLKDSGLDQKTVHKCKNMFTLGMASYIYNRPIEHIYDYLERKFGKKHPELIAPNRKVLTDGYNYASNIQAIANTYTVVPANMKKGLYRNITGNQAIAWGFLAASEKSGRPLFCGSYPITPATGILEELAIHKYLGAKTVQAEDEIAGVCTAIGAAFAGDLAVTTTSGPGLSLKSEALGLAVMTELPLVVVDVQRAGPSTGIPTKTEQTDLAQALYGRNGECPMVIVAAHSPANCFDTAFTAAKIALEHMTPVILLSEGFLGNGSERLPTISNDYGVSSFSQTYSGVNENGLERDRAINNNLAGTWGFGARLKDVSFLEDIRHTLHVSFFGGTNDSGILSRLHDRTGSWMAPNNPDGTSYVGRDNVYMTQKDYAFEVGLSNKFKIYDNLRFNLDVTYVTLWLDKSDNTWGRANTGGGSNQIRDAWNISTLFIYYF